MCLLDMIRPVVLWAVVFECSLLSPVTLAQPEGVGSADVPHGIASAADLLAVADDPDAYTHAHLVLTDDIDMDPNLPGNRILNQAIFAPNLGTSSIYVDFRFQGRLDGQGHTISNLVFRAISIQSRHFRGLFGATGFNARSQDVVLEDALIDALADSSMGLTTRDISRDSL